ncbi:MAG: nodulation protein NfeD [Calditrichaceae bacterium]|nr:nodulation protein NfeD [Calditrichaceae bacterium]MBN2710478.1 nodulation protein NfeD [Calditrichaceae bacterium]RQV97269.1 MAG: nodulation protein NfeD [Calditrichota bacterium]
MKKLLYLLNILILTFGILQARVAHRIVLDGSINPVATDYIIEAIENAEDAEAEILIIELDTPGGLMESMRLIMKAIQASEVPVLVYVAPTGARAGSAGVFITYSAHITAMAPATNIGSAHPVFGGGIPGSTPDSTTMDDMMEKVINDAVARIRAIAEIRGRNADWAEKAIRESANITETEALKLNVIDYIAPTLDSLLTTINGKEIKLDNGTVKILNTKDVSVTLFEMNWRQKLLDIISDPNISYILLMLALFGFIFELYNPGGIIPGVIAGISLILWLFSVQTLPVNYAGILLILLAIILFLLEIKIPSFGMLTIGGVISLIMGSIMLFEGAEVYLRVSWQTILVVVITSVAFFVFAVGLTIKAHKRKPTTGKEGMVGETGLVYKPLNPEGTVKIHGEFWKAVSEQPLKKGQKVKVVKYDGVNLILHVKPE